MSPILHQHVLYFLCLESVQTQYWICHFHHVKDLRCTYSFSLVGLWTLNTCQAASRRSIVTWSHRVRLSVSTSINIMLEVAFQITNDFLLNMTHFKILAMTSILGISRDSTQHPYDTGSITWPLPGHIVHLSGIIEL